MRPYTPRHGTARSARGRPPFTTIGFATIGTGSGSFACPFGFGFFGFVGIGIGFGWRRVERRDGMFLAVVVG
jgi:hypothetical protein